MSSGKKEEKPAGGGENGGRKSSGKKSKASSEQKRLSQESAKNYIKEEQSLKEKIKWVMEVTARSEDEACTALHDTDYDPEKAIGLLIEGKAQEWSCIKKKTRGNGGGNGEKGGPTRKVINDQIKKGTGEPDYEWQENEASLLGVKGARGGRGGGKPVTGTWRGQGWKGKENKEDLFDRGGERGGWRQGGGGGGINGTTRRQEHQRRPSPSESDIEDSQPLRRNQMVFVNKNFVAWNNLPPSGLPSLLAQAKVLGSSSQADEYDYEEYTGSLADSKVFTSSIQKPSPSTSTGAEPHSPSHPSQTLTSSPLPRPSRPTYADIYRNREQQQVRSRYPPHRPRTPNPPRPSYQQQRYQPVRYQVHHQPPAIELGNNYY